MIFWREASLRPFSYRIVCSCEFSRLHYEHNITKWS